VALVARSAERLAEVVAGFDGRGIAVVCDLAQPSQVDAAVPFILRTLGVPDIVVNNAGVFALGRVGVMPPDEMSAMLSLNLVAPYRLLHALVPPMRERGSGHLVTIGSVADRATYPENAAYSAAKFGARAMHQVLREELRGSGVRASLVSPGPTDTPLWDPIGPDLRPGFTPRRAMLSPEAVADAVHWVITRPREVNVDELRVSRS